MCLSVFRSSQSPAHRKLVLSVILGEDLVGLRAATLALLALAIRLSWFPLMAASRRDFRSGEDEMRDLGGGIQSINVQSTDTDDIIWIQSLCSHDWSVKVRV